MLKTQFGLLAILIATACQTASASVEREALAALANCDPSYFRHLKSMSAELRKQGVRFALNGENLRVVAPQSTDVPIVPARPQKPIKIGGLHVLGFIDATMKDEFDGSIEHIWGIWTAGSIDDTARAMNALLAPERQAQKVYDTIYVRSEKMTTSGSKNNWRLAQPLRYGTPLQGVVTKGFIVESTLSIESSTPFNMTLATCNLHGRTIPQEILRTERPDIADKNSGQ